MDMPLNLIEQEAIEATTRHRTMIWVYVLFFFSGFPALIYQVVWQRALFAIYGVNIESVTMVVGAFMLGLGLGSLLGGFISKRPAMPLLVIFGLVELGTACFGVISLHLFHFAATFTAGVPALETGLIAFILVVIPTIFMGSTLPLLVAFMVPLSRNVGRSVGTLYFLNTMGSAFACFLAGKILMRVLGQSGSVTLAAAMNATIGISVLVAYYLFYRQTTSMSQDHTEGEDSGTARTSAGLLPFPLAILIAGAAGFISLSYEIIWYRLYSFASGGEAKSFAYLLGAFLAGIAIGSALSQRLCQDMSDDKDKTQYIRLIALFVVSANLLGFAVAPLFSFAVRFMVYTHTLPLVMITAAFLGAVFPLICHVSIPPDSRAGAGLSYLYVSNILGSTLGTFVVGFVLMDILSLRQLAVALAVMGLVLGALILMSSRPKRFELSAVLGSTVALAALIGLSSSSLFAGIYERMQPSPEYVRGVPFTHIVETKSGIVTVDASGTIYGGGIYDGRFNTNLVENSDANMIIRAFSLSSFHSSPKEVLSIGLSSGSWAQVIANHPQVESLTVVEINPGYLQLIPQYPQVASVLQNPKVKIEIDDGRRWLVRNPTRRFDVIVDNTSFYWRANVTNLLSMEFLRLIRLHLKPGGVFFYNTTGSEEAQLTGATVFPYALRVMNFLAVSDSPIQVDRERWKRTLAAYRIDGKPVFDLTQPEQQQRLDEVLSLTDIQPGKRMAMEYADTLRERYEGKRLFTDDNMGMEWYQ